MLLGVFMNLTIDLNNQSLLVKIEIGDEEGFFPIMVKEQWILSVELQPSESSATYRFPEQTPC